VELQGSPTAAGFRHPGRFAVVVSRFNEEITEGLLAGARRALAEAQVPDDHVTIVRVPGSFEVPLTALRLARTERFSAIVCLGCLIKGETMHFEYLAEATCQGIAAASRETGVPMAFGVLTALTVEQAQARAGDTPDNKGREAARAAIEMATLFHLLDGGKP
jgi:6,7-dimethyl-8-ribityllumazine synthase